MPVYDYKCKRHGIFSGLATIKDAEKPIPCPQCSALCPRVILLAPSVIDFASARHRANDMNERNQHEPAISTKARRSEDTEHRTGCGCDKKGLATKKLIYTADGKKLFPSARPWMISH